MKRTIHLLIEKLGLKYTYSNLSKNVMLMLRLVINQHLQPHTARLFNHAKQNHVNVFFSTWNCKAN
jgi:hypothetical protein